MSYILEALKRSEQERNQTSIPALRTARGSTRHRRSVWLGAVIGVGMLSLLAAAAWLVKPQWFHSASTRDAAVTADIDAPQSAAPQTDASGGTPSANDQTTRQSPAASGRERVSSLSEMDEDARARIQGLSVNVVSYSTVPERRFVMLNQRIVHESETVADGVTLKRILPQGALLSVGDYEIVLEPE